MLLHDLYGHQAWADAEHWRTLEAHPVSLEDGRLRERLHHIHHVQRLFLWTARGGTAPFERSAPEDFPRPADLKAWARSYHEEALAYVAALDEQASRRRVAIPWMKEPRLELTVEEALAQGALHSQYHRGQNATRLRELGGAPTVTDLVLWYARGRPAAAWP